MNYTDPDRSNHTYSATVQIDESHSGIMTDTGVQVQDLLPIGDAILTPGDPSPIGRTEDGDLAYAIFPSETHMRLTRREVANLAYAWAKAHNITDEPNYPLEIGSPEILFASLVSEALPDELYQDTKHGDMAKTQDLKDLLAGNIEALEHLWQA